MTNWVDQLNSHQRLAQRQIEGYGTSPQDFILNLQQAYGRYLNSFDQNERKELWRCMHLLAIDLATVTEKPCPEPEKLIYDQLAKD